MCVYVKVNGSVFVRIVHLYALAACKQVDDHFMAKNGRTMDIPILASRVIRTKIAQLLLESREGERNGSALWLISYETFFFLRARGLKKPFSHE